MVIGVAVISVHIICYLIIIYGKAQWFTPEQQIDLGLLFLPVTSAYLLAIVRSAIQDQHRHSRGLKVNLNYCIIVVLVTFATLAGLLITIIQISGDLDLARRQILLFEIAFGTAFGLIASDLFGDGGSGVASNSSTNQTSP
jgi:hypothetical protein